MDTQSPVNDFSSVLAALRDVDTPFPSRYLRSFSDLSRSQLKALNEVWPSLPDERKLNLLEDLDEVLEKDTLVNFENLAINVLTDANPMNRVLALRLLWESENTDILPVILALSVNDADEAVRSTSAGLLGRFVLMGELETIRSDISDLVNRHLLNVLISSDTARVKQRALESLGFSSHPDVPDLIRNAYLSNDSAWVVSALCAMGRSADEQWADQVEESLNSPIAEVQMEAIKAAGELELSGVKEQLLSMITTDTEDTEIRMALVWALSQIGGDEIRERLEQLLADATDEDEIDWIDRALENLELASASGLELLDFAPEHFSGRNPVDDNEDENEDDEYFEDEGDEIDLDDFEFDHDSDEDD